MLGVAPEAAQEWASDDEEDACEVWPEHWDTVAAFCALGTQWRVAAGMGGLIWLGLDYNAIPAVLRLQALPRSSWPEVFEGLRIMERAAAKELNRKK